MNSMRKGSGLPLLLVHGLGGNRHSFDTIIDALAAQREVIAIDLPGFGETPPLAGEVSIRTLADAVGAFLAENGLTGVDAVGSSMGARLVLELARRGDVGATVALDPGGFWTDRERRIFGASVALSVRLLRVLEPVLPAITASRVARTLLLAQFSSRPWRLSPEVTLRELRSFVASASFDEALESLVHGPLQDGAAAGSTRGPITIGWGRRDYVTLPRQAKRALARFPGARLEWFDGSGHFPHWDAPEDATRVILAATG